MAFKKSFQAGVCFWAGILSIFSIAYAAISWPSTPSGEVTGGKYSEKLVPSGFVGAFNLASCPTGWTVADGNNGTPDLRGAFVRGMNGSANGRDGARALASYQADELKSHNHPVRDILVSGALGSNEWLAWHNGVMNSYNYGSNASYPVIGVVGGTETRPKNVALLYCVKN